ncbi:MAG: hypothetical protein ACJATT_000758 [Myxococcota bacterium]|jgi:hypothetical protein
MRLDIVIVSLALTACGANKCENEGTIRNATLPPPRVVQNPDAGLGVIVPGEHVGPLRPDTTRAGLAERLSEAALKDQDVDIGEGQVQAGTVIHAGTDHELRVVWQSPARQTLAWVHVIGTAWELPGGLHPGASLADTQQSLGTFRFNGFVGDDSGFIHLIGTPLASYAASTSLRLVVEPDRLPCQSSTLHAQLLSSDAPEVQACSPNLGDVILRF